MNGNGRPIISNKKLVRFCLALTILAWATQVLFKQWGFGADIPPAARVQITSTPASTNTPAAIAAGTGGDADDRRSMPADRSVDPGDRAVPAGDRLMPSERFIAPRADAAPIGVTMELRQEATVNGAEVRLKQIARWSATDAEFFRQAGELVLARLEPKSPYRSFDLAEVRKTLSDAGVNIALIRFSGPMSCTVNRADTKVEPESALAKWIETKEKAAPTADDNRASPLPTAGSVSITPRSPVSAAKPIVTDRPAVRALRDLLTEDVSTRLRVPLEQLQLKFNPKDDRVLNLCEPQFRFNLEPQRVRNLGEVSWTVTIVADGSNQKTTIIADARAWQTQVVANRAIAYRAPIRADDVAEKRVLADRLPDEPLLTTEQVVGQQAAQEIHPGTTLTGRMVEPVPVVRRGQLVTVTLKQGGIRMVTVATATEDGAAGQRVRVRDEEKNRLYSVTMTGPQEGVLGQ